MFKLLYSPDDAPGAAGNVGQPAAMDKESLIEFLSDETDAEDKETIDIGDKPSKDKTGETEEEEDDTKETKKTGKEVDETDEEEEEDDELKDIEEELDEPSEEQLELVTPVRRREILQKYPQLFKDFPYLEKAYYREQQFTELHPTIEDARQSKDKADTLDRFETDLMDGNVETIFSAIKNQDVNSFYHIIDNLLPTLAKVDQPAYFHVLGNVMKHTIVAMVEEANTSKNDTLKSAAQILHQYVFGNSKFSPPTNLYKPDNGKDGGKNAEMDKREQDFRQKQFTTAHSALNTKVSNVIKNTIAQHIDPRGSMTEYVKGHAVNEAVSQLNRLISNDARFRALLDKMWEKAFQSDFDEESTNRIRRAITSKAKTLLPSVIKRARNDALRGIGKRVREEEDTPSKRGPIPAGRPQSQSSGKIKKAGDIPKGMTTLEFLNSD